MTFDEWAAAIAGELQAAGYSVDFYQGFPLVERPQEWDRGVALIDWRSPTGLPCCKRIYAEGMLFTPTF